MKSKRSNVRRYNKRNSLKRKRTRSKSNTKLRRRTRRMRRNRKQYGGQSTPLTTTPSCNARQIIDNNAIAMQLYHPNPNNAQQQLNSYNDYAMVNDRSGMYVHM